MAALTYGTITSLDGYVEDAQGRFDWGAPDGELTAYINALERPVGTYLYGRRMYETMVFWETASAADDDPAFVECGEIWRAAEKVVYSRTLQEVSSARTRLERAFDLDAIRQLKRSAAADLEVAGAELAGQALRAGLVDEIHLYVCPVAVGGGKRALPDGLSAPLELLDQHRFPSGVVHLHYRVESAAS